MGSPRYLEIIASIGGLGARCGRLLHLPSITLPCFALDVLMRRLATFNIHLGVGISPNLMLDNITPSHIMPARRPFLTTRHMRLISCAVPSY